MSIVLRFDLCRLASICLVSLPFFLEKISDDLTPAIMQLLPLFYKQSTTTAMIKHGMKIQVFLLFFFFNQLYHHLSPSPHITLGILWRPCMTCLRSDKLEYKSKHRPPFMQSNTVSEPWTDSCGCHGQITLCTGKSHSMVLASDTWRGQIMFGSLHIKIAMWKTF